MLLIIDEVSMVGQICLTGVTWVGQVSILAVGDFYQLLVITSYPVYHQMTIGAYQIARFSLAAKLPESRAHLKHQTT